MRTYFTNLLKQSTLLILIIVLGSSFKHASKFFAGNYNYYVSPGEMLTVTAMRMYS